MILRFTGFAILIPILGLQGAALSTTISLAIVAVALNVLCRRWVGLDPSILILFRKPRGTIVAAGPVFAHGHRVTSETTQGQPT
jgi:hypothetical protein